MKLNRTQALFLVGTIAAIGCVVENSDDGGDDNGSAGDAGEGGTSGSTTGGSAGSYAGGTSSGGTSTGGGGGQGGEACLDDATSPVACEDFAEPGAGGIGAGGIGAGGESYGGAGGAGGPACESLGQDLFCADLWTNFKPGVANAARTCMNAQTPEDLCTWAFSHGCASEAILAACPDDSANDECEAIMAGCPDLTLADCSSVLGAMTQTGRDMVVNCAAESLECNPWICAGVASPAGE